MAYIPAAHPGGHMPPPPSSKVELKVRCRNLPDRDAFSKSDPQVFLFLFDNITGTWRPKPHATTERIKNSLNPDFVKSLELEYHFESIQRLKFVVFDIDDKHSNSWSDQDFLGEAETDLGTIIGSRGRQHAITLHHPRFPIRGGQIIIRAEELSSSKRFLNFKIRALDLSKKILMVKRRPSAFFVIQRSNDNGTFSPVYKSKHIKDHDDPTWKPFSIKETMLCNANPVRSIKVEVWNKKDDGDHVLIGTTKAFTVAEMEKWTFPHRLDIPPMTGTSCLIIESMVVEEPPSFIDFIAGGGSIGLCVAIDFTQSNGEPSDPSSLHHRSPTGDNEYTRAIHSVGNVLQCYDTDKKFPVYGFGGRINGQVSHAFPLNGNIHNPEVGGVQGILAAYWQAHSFVELYGPTNFANVIGEATEIARHHEPYGYTVLLILTDGAISDMDATLRAIRRASDHALSIIIVGVGNANFANMNTLDGDDEDGISSGGYKKTRDIVQFVAARDFPPHREHGLAEALLAEIPDQFLQYMRLHNIKPKPPIRADTVLPSAVDGAAAVGAHASPVPAIPGSPYNPATAGAHVPPTGVYPPPAGAYPPPTGHPPAGAYPPPTGAYPPAGHPPPAQHYPGAPAGPYPTGYPGYQQPSAYPYGAVPPGQHPMYPPQPGVYQPYPGNVAQYPPGYPVQYPPQPASHYPPAGAPAPKDLEKEKHDDLKKAQGPEPPRSGAPQGTETSK